MSFQFVPLQPRDWTGRYGAIPGKASRFHVRYRDHHHGLWPYALMREDEDKGTCWAVECMAAGDLASAVLRAKQWLGGEGCGSLLINEFGQVIVPATEGDGRRAIVGSISGTLRFKNPYKDNATYDLADTAGLHPGDRWDRPYVGTKYNWWDVEGIHYRTSDDRGAKRIVCPRQDQALIASIKKIRHDTTYMRFIVNPHGLVLTKQRVGNSWFSVYVGKINYSLWFDKEA